MPPRILVGNVLFPMHHPIGWIGATLMITAVAGAALPLLIVGLLKQS